MENVIAKPGLTLTKRSVSEDARTASGSPTSASRANTIADTVANKLAPRDPPQERVAALARALDLPADAAKLQAHIAAVANTPNLQKLWQFRLHCNAPKFGMANAESLDEAAVAFVTMTGALQRATHFAAVGNVSECATAMDQARTTAQSYGHHTGPLELRTIKNQAYISIGNELLDARDTICVRQEADDQKETNDSKEDDGLLYQLLMLSREETFSRHNAAADAFAARLAAVWGNEVSRKTDEHSDVNGQHMLINSHLFAARCAGIDPMPHVVHAASKLIGHVQQNPFNGCESATMVFLEPLLQVREI